MNRRSNLSENPIVLRPSSIERMQSSGLRPRTLIMGAWLAVALLAAVACKMDRPADFATASALPSGPRRPDGVAVDLQGSMPPASTRANTSLGLVALREPVDMSGALSSVRTFFEAVAREDATKMRTVLTLDAQVNMPSGPNNSGMRAEDAWERRFGKFDYKATGPEPVFRETAVEMYGFRDLEEAEGDRPVRPPIMEEQDVLIRVPIEIRRVGTDRLFGDEIVFLVRRVDGVFRIRALYEDFQAY
jgi:hypothetical protein